MKRSDIRRAALPPPRPGVAASLTYYPPGLEQDAHDHSGAHVSVLLTGAFEERSRTAEHLARPGDMLLRGASFRHGVTYGAMGALILTLQSRDACADAQAAAPRRAAVPPESATAAPAWALEARSRLLANPAAISLSQLAHDFQVHRVHLSRAFQAHFGARPSILRREAMVGHALALALSEEEPLAACAQAAGFADQAHLTRAVRAVCGFPPARLRALLA